MIKSHTYNCHDLTYMYLWLRVIKFIIVVNAQILNDLQKRRNLGGEISAKCSLNLNFWILLPRHSCKQRSWGEFRLILFAMGWFIRSTAFGWPRARVIWQIKKGRSSKTVPKKFIDRRYVKVLESWYTLAFGSGSFVGCKIIWGSCT